MDCRPKNNKNSINNEKFSNVCFGKIRIFRIFANHQSLKKCLFNTGRGHTQTFHFTISKQ